MVSLVQFRNYTTRLLNNSLISSPRTAFFSAFAVRCVENRLVYSNERSLLVAPLTAVIDSHL